MESQQSVNLQNPTSVNESPKSGSTSEVQNSSNSTWDFGVLKNDANQALKPGNEVIGIVEVFIHQARDIHNICIYHKQDVYAKLCLTSDPDTTASTHIVNGGGKNPVFNENLSLNVRTIEASVKCEIWMLSRVRNYLEDQLLGFTLVPLSDVLNGNGGKLSQEFVLSSTDLFHSPAGFVQLSLSYIGTSPDVVEVSAPQLAVNGNENEVSDLRSCTEELAKLEFPDPKLLNENHLMVSEYFELSCIELHPENSEIEAEEEKLTLIGSASVDEGKAAEPSRVVAEISSSVSTNGSPTLSASESASSQSVRINNAKPDLGDAESGSSNVPTQDFAKLAVTVPIDTKQEVVQQDYVDMYLKSMQQFTDSLAKMKLPLENDSGSGTTVASDINSPASANGKGPKVFYGSRAFF